MTTQECDGVDSSELVAIWAGERIRITGLERDHRHRHRIPLMLEEQRQVARFHIA